MRLYEDDLGLGLPPAESPMLVAPSSDGIGISQPDPHMGLEQGSAPSGLGLGAEQAPAPVVEMQPRPVVNRATSQLDARRALIDQMSGTEKFGAALREVGAAMQGHDSPLDKRIKAQREERALQATELKANISLLHETVAEVQKISDPEARKKYVDAIAPTLEANQAGMGAALRTFADNPGMLEKLKNIIPKLPAHMQDLAKADPAAFIKAATTAEGLKEINRAYDDVELSTAAKKAKPILIGYQQIVPPALAKKIDEQGYMTASQFNKIQDDLPDNHPAKMTDKQREVANKSETFFQSLGVMSPKEEAEVRKKKAEGENKADKESALAILIKERDALPEGSAARKSYDARIKKETEHAPGVTVQNMPSSSGMGLNPATGKPAHFTIGKDGEVRWDKVEPLPKEVDPVKKAIADALGGKKPVAGKDAPKAADAPALPPAIAAALKPNVNSKLSDGTTWTLGADGKPKKVK